MPAATNVPANRPSPKSEVVLRREAAFKDLGDFLTKPAVARQLALALPKHMTADRILRMALSAANREPLLLECSMESIGLSLIRCAEYGVEPDGWEAHLVPFKDKGVRKCQLIVDYKGLCKLAYQSEMVLEIQADVVRKGDKFEYKRGTGAFLDHTPSNTDPPGEMEFAWAMARIKGGGEPFIVLNKRQVMEHKKASSAAGSDYSPWNKQATEPAMWMKTAVRVLCKMLPRSPTLRSLLKHEDDAELGIGDTLEGVLLGEGEGEQAETETKSDRTAARLEDKQKTLGGMAAIKADFDAAKDVATIQKLYDQWAGPESPLNEEDRGRVSNFREMRMAVVKGQLFGTQASATEAGM